MGKEKQVQSQIAWLASYPKSGNTWIRTFIQAYSFNEIDINNLFATQGDIDPRVYNTLSANDLNHMTNMEILHLRSAALLRIIHLSSFFPVVTKTHNSNSVIGDVALIPNYLTRNAIYVVRDPRDMVVSYAKHMGLSHDETIQRISAHDAVVTNKWNISHFLSDWSTHVKSWLHQNEFPVLRMRFEDMKQYPEREFEKLVLSLGFTLNGKQLKKAIDMSNIKNLKKQEKEKTFYEASSSNPNGFFGKGAVGGWKNILDSEQVRAIEQAHGEAMEAMGYELEVL